MAAPGGGSLLTRSTPRNELGGAGAAPTDWLPLARSPAPAKSSPSRGAPTATNPGAQTKLESQDLLRLVSEGPRQLAGRLLTRSTPRNDLGGAGAASTDWLPLARSPVPAKSSPSRDAPPPANPVARRPGSKHDLLRLVLGSGLCAPGIRARTFFAWYQSLLRVGRATVGLQSFGSVGGARIPRIAWTNAGKDERQGLTNP